MKDSSNKISLNGSWHYIKDADEELSFEKIIEKFKKYLTDGEMNIPTNWQLAGLDNFNGACWFVKEFSFDERDSDDLVQLHFKGVDYFCDVWLNNHKLGRHEGYFQPFHFNISTHIKTDCQNTLVVSVSSPLEVPKRVWPYKKKLIKGIFNHHDCRPGGWSYEHGQDKNTGGIWNDVFIETGKLIIDNLKITPSINWKDNTADIKISFVCHSSINENAELSFDIISPGNDKTSCTEKVLLTSGDNVFTTSIKIDEPSLWWCADLGEPNLYNLKILYAGLSLVEASFGIREVCFNNKHEFYLNRKKLFLRGTNIIPTQFLSSLSKEKIRQFVYLLKEANINIVRVHAHVNRKELYDAFDKAGIMVWQDFALQWTYDESKEFSANAVSQIKEMVKLLYNNPSIVFWCCHNEPGDQINTLDPLLYAALQSEDDTRVIRIASNYEEHPYDGWYWGNKEHFAAAPMGPLVTEFGAQALPERESLSKFLTKDEIEKPDWQKWKYHNFQYEQTFNVAEINSGDNINEFVNNSQQYQADLIKTAIDFYRRKKFNNITGIFQFMFIDCWESITWSVVDFYGKPKKGFYALKEAFQPVYVSVFLRQKKYFPGSMLQTDIWIINDLYNSYDNCELKVIINKKSIGEIKGLSIQENGIQFIDYKSIDISLPSEINMTSHFIHFQLMDNETSTILSESRYEIEFVNKKF